MLFCSLKIKGGLPRKIAFDVLSYNYSVVFNLLRVWNLFRNASSHSCFRFFTLRGKGYDCDGSGGGGGGGYGGGGGGSNNNITSNVLSHSGIVCGGEAGAESEAAAPGRVITKLHSIIKARARADYERSETERSRSVFF